MKVISMSILLFLSGLVYAQTAASEIYVLKRHIDAFNKHDVEALIENLHPEYMGFYIGNDTVEPAYVDIPSFRKDMTDYFKMFPDVHSDPGGISMIEGKLMFTETVTWSSMSGEKSQSSLAIYKIKDDKVYRSWYYVD